MLSSLLGFLLGAILGSFTPVLAERSLTEDSLWGRSRCNKCKKTLKWYDLFPIFSFLVLRGQCRSCHTSIPKYLFFTELSMAFISALIVYQSIPDLTIFTTFNLDLLMTLLLIVTKLFGLVLLVAVCLTDLKTGLIPNRITFPATVIAFVLRILLLGAQLWSFTQNFDTSPLAKYLRFPYSDYFNRHLITILQSALWDLGTAVVLAFAFILLILGTRGRGMGRGDVKYILVLGLLLGFPNAILATFLAFLSGALVAIILIFTKKKHFGQTIPFGPFLSLGALITLLWGDQIISWYIQLH